MGISKKITNKAKLSVDGAAPAPPELARRRANRQSTLKSGRTIGEKRERLETANERAAARKKDKHRQTSRIILTSLGFIAIIAVILFILYFSFPKKDDEPVPGDTPATELTATIEIVDEDSATTGGKITGRMRDYIARMEADFRDLGYTPTKAVIPAGSIREVDFYLDGHPGFIKTTIDRDAAVTTEDADRMLHYLAGIGISEFTYIDVRLEGKAYWK